ncbi:hypothetical protein WR164_15840 [Philodulcilactobacillus myokoensis]|uniref:SDR-like Ig domain-containing protein n=1 Tax=Philodulcilactobacillus myokoensis TaxID=2929573 RepID=A0A9W6B2C3_9LACO|nr:collagen binding domain-containing protein [Philodulcilactobacillus myokoensis]GLB47605.1 hypothetical protein WR164_15840 [Philodulcilactobacillus myokoensis]
MKKIFLRLIGCLIVLTSFGLISNHAEVIASNTGTVQKTPEFSQNLNHNVKIGDEIKDASGNDVSNQSQLDRYQNYHLIWNWQLNDASDVKSGDTILFKLPNNVQALSRDQFDVYNNQHQTVGSFTINRGSDYGILKFNNQLLNRQVDRHGSINLNVNGKYINQTSKNWFINKIGWWPDNQHQRITWNVAFNPNLQHLNHIVLNDTIGPNQSYMSNSVTAQLGKWDAHNHFVANGQTTPVSVTNNGSHLLFHFSKPINDGVNLTYQTNANGNSNGGTYNNEVSIDGDGIHGEPNTSINATISFGGNGTVLSKPSSNSNPNPNQDHDGHPNQNCHSNSKHYFKIHYAYHIDDNGLIDAGNNQYQWHYDHSGYGQINWDTPFSW